MTEAVLAQATGSFYRRTPGPALRGTFASIWVHRMDADSAPPVVITPDATIDLQWIDGRFRVAGPDKEPHTEILAAGDTVIGMRFHPAAASAWFGVPISDLLDQRLPLEDLWGRRAQRLACRVGVQDNLEDMLCSLEAALAQEDGTREADHAMQAAYGLIERGAPSGAPLIPWLMRALALSERTLRRRFDESFGYGPKTLDRILRYQRFLQLAAQSDSTTAILASEAGYSDQAHLARESRRLTGSTPREVDRLLSASDTRELHN